MNRDELAYAAPRAAVAQAVEAYREVLVSTLKLYGANLSDLFETTHSHTAGLLLGDRVVVPMVFSVQFGGMHDHTSFERLCEQRGWNKRIVIDGEERKLD